MSRAEAILWTMESEMPRTHHVHIGRLQAKVMREAVKEQMKAAPDQKRLAALKAEADTLEREKDDKTYTRTKRDLIEPLKLQARNEKAVAEKLNRKHQKLVTEAKERRTAHARPAASR
ncbi:hypothetical protein LMG31884_47170 (plasmid) [Xanthomonas hydrangeae]|uniref:hypothetical protein n=1 Tax=Xanthomonas hydrangeae TaxID=2775159 RepID=UPI001964525C|nr:hypothetical protein LMG31884_47170 [Xanthomonas hydrangeae]CAD7741015.1 hypothetical protein LMG31884_47170 [Xanthomonas hydrangeae]CAD7747986.1 hypothetical protein LMG31887_46640 [Xanthomonas hydrangeae]CAD7747987.1 hypothetical protein LMG31887_46640 [Xanthomonas hydrangeae]CAD7748136.1 hypothetical protein LMG31885_44850 [Xanthomonas hydrangeae]